MRTGLLAFTVSWPTNITFPSIFSNSRNVTSSNDPVELNNTANQYTRNISLNATDLVGEANSAYRIGGENFSVSTITGGSDPNYWECNWSSPVGNRVYGPTALSGTQINGSVLAPGSVAADDGSEDWYVCLLDAGILIEQAYTTNGANSEGNWTIRVT